jgi:2-amino-4-hydroxy-6-hydroxymethyldihydropteridine diphosphokinase
MSNVAYLSLGSNLGNRLEFLRKAIQLLHEHPQIRVVDVSSVYETEPVGYIEQDRFLNMAVKIETTLSPEQLLDTCLEIEKSLGRVREVKWGPRTIDLDILLYNDDNRKTEKLIVPHPRLQDRAFVLIPLLEIDRSLQHPTLQQPLQQMLDELQDRKGVRLWKPKNGEDVFAHLEN